jgi:Leucine-rich repeat (LRR) protein
MRPGKLTSRCKQVPGDVVQGMLEYLTAVRDMLQCRCVCSLWRRVVADAVGYINGRQWTNLVRVHPMQLEQHFISGFTQRTHPLLCTLVARFAIACLWHRLETVHWSNVSCPKPTPQVLPLRILGINSSLKSLSLHGPFIRDVEFLQHFTALTDLSIVGQRGMDSTEFFNAIAEIKSLVRLHLPRCEVNIDVNALRRCADLRVLDLSQCVMVNSKVAAAIFRIPNLQSLTLSCCPRVKDKALANHDDPSEMDTPVVIAAALPDGSRTHVPWSLNHIELKNTTIPEASVLADCCELQEAAFSSCLIPDGTLTALARLPKLQKLRFDSCPNIRNLGALRDCSALRELVLTGISLQEADLGGLEEIDTLEVLDLQLTKVSNVDCLQRCPKLRSLYLQSTLMTDAALVAVARIATLEDLVLRCCRQIHSASALAECQALRKLDLAFTEVRDVDGLERIPTLTSLSLYCCTQLANITSMSRCQTLLKLDISRTPAASAAGLRDLFAGLPALQLLTNSHCW